MCLIAPSTSEGFDEEELEEQLFREGAGSDIMASWQQYEDEHRHSHQVREALRSDLQTFAMHNLQMLMMATWGHPPACGDDLEVLEGGLLALSIFSDLDARSILGSAFATLDDVADDSILKKEVFRTCLAVINLSSKFAFQGGEMCALNRTSQLRKELDVSQKEQELVMAVSSSICRPTAASWLRLFGSRLMAIRGRDPMAQKWLDFSLQNLKWTPPMTMIGLPPRQLAARFLAGAASSLGLEQELVSSFKFVTGLDMSSFAGEQSTTRVIQI
eukprot:TRINITY_DN7673_c0_g1_i1.p1 TRINITY_DN7673_c0_g1~~TRINITY_DN7673_c0_g1_i1.p1  ORF type:complete len:273 (+),score=55.90 TRINITY_DN7673_c0_g1_i1:53-871(+)